MTRKRRKQTALVRGRNRIGDGGSLAMRRQNDVEVNAMAERERDDSRAQMTAVNVEYRLGYEQRVGASPETTRPVALSEPTKKAERLKLWATVLVVGDLLLTYIFATDGLVKGSEVVLVTLGVSLVLIAGASAIVMMVDHLSPTPLARHRHLAHATLVVLPIWLISFIGYLLVRNPSLGLLQWLQPYRAWLGAGLSLSTAALSALCQANADLHFWSKRLADKWDMENQFAAEFEALRLATIGIVEIPIPMNGSGPLPSDPFKSTPPSNGSHTPDVHPVATGAGRIALAFLLLTVPLHLARGQEFRVDALAPSQGVPCGLLNDWTSSVRSSERSVALTTLNRVMSESGDRCRQGSWDIVNFTDDAFTVMPTATVRWPSPLRPGCPSPILRGDTARFRVLREAKLEEHEANCRTELARARQRFDEERESADRALERAFHSAPVRKGECTSLFDALERAAAAGGISIILTDGQESCRPRVRRPIAQTDASVVVVVIARERGASDGSDWFAGRKKALLDVAPWARVVPMWALSAALKASR